MKTYIQLIAIEKIEFHLLFDKHDRPIIQMHHKEIDCLTDLFHTFHFLKYPQHAPKTAQICNFLLTGFDFHYIDDIEQFQKDYKEKIESEQSDTSFQSDSLLSLSHYGTYDVSVMHPPQLINGILTFFVKNDYTHLPYKASIDLHNLKNASHASYELLPSI